MDSTSNNTAKSYNHQQHIGTFNLKRRLNYAIGEASKFVSARQASATSVNQQMDDSNKASVRLHRQQRYADTSQYYATISLSAGQEVRAQLDGRRSLDDGAVGQVVRRPRRRADLAQVVVAHECSRPLMTKELLSRNEFDPNKCHQVRSEQQLLTIKRQGEINDDEDQQVVEILSDDDGGQEFVNNLTPSDQQKLNLPEKTLQQRLQQMDTRTNEQDESSSAESTPTQRKRTVTSSQHNTTAAAPQYFIRHSLNNSIRSRHNHLKRASRRSANTARTSVRRRSGRQARQVRFQPVAQAIDISIEQSANNTSVDETKMPTSGEPTTTTKTGSGGGKQFVRVQQQLHRLGRKTRLHNYLAGSGAKPLVTRQLNHHPVMSQLKQLTGKIKLKSFNSLASQLQQTFSAAGSSASVELATSGCATTTTTTQQQRPATKGTHKLASKGFRLLAQKAAHAIATSTGTMTTTTTISGTGSGPAIQRTFHLRHSAASARNQLTLSGGATGSGADDAMSQEDEDGWGSDFDESCSKPEDEGDSDVSQDDETTATEGVGQVERRSGGRYLLEIGKSSGDSRAIHDVIQDQGLSGQFKRLDLSGDLSPEVAQDEPEVAADEEEEEDDAAELASLEARQNYRQVRDKLKLILDQRLATYERAAVVPVANEVGVTQPEVVNGCPATSSIDIRATGSGQVKQNLGEPGGEAPPPVPVTGQVQVIVAAPVAVLPVPATATSTQTSTGTGKHCDRFDDCQSNCSEASSLSSNGLDSNHSEGQDSGHSTQHSGYSASGSTSGGSGGQISPSTQLDSGASTCGDNEVQVVTVAAGVDPKSSGKATAKSGSCVSEEEKERRDRFKQNRSIINSKLESMFKSRSTSALHSSNSTSRSSLPAQVNDSPKSVQSCPTSTPAPVPLPGQQQRPVSLAVSLGGSENKLEAAIRLRLLEQQRQMSLKLKQKPRRRSAKRALNLISSPSPVCSIDDGGSSINSTTTNASLDQISTQSSAGLAQCQATSIINNDTLTKQLSMVCLRRLAGPPPAPLAETDRQVKSVTVNQQVNKQQQLKPKPALSLRQLVKEVIDDCETPGKLSTLTRNILNRSDSLSSEALSSSDLSPVTSSANEQQQIDNNHQVHEFKSSSPLKRLSNNNCDNSITTSSLNMSTTSGITNIPTTPQQIKPIGLIPNQQQHNSQFSTPFRSNTTTNHLVEYHNYQPAIDHSLIMTTTSSSLGTIDGLEYSPTGACPPLDQSSILAEHQQPQQPPSCLKQPQKATTSSGGIGSYWKNLRQFSRFKMNKVNMAYLDNTNNFFTDDDN